VSLALADRAEPRDGSAGRVHPNFAGIEHAETENVAILDRSGADDVGKEADACRVCSVNSNLMGQLVFFRRSASPAGEIGSQRTRRRREPDLNPRSLVGTKMRDCAVGLFGGSQSAGRPGESGRRASGFCGLPCRLDYLGDARDLA
jgi:hypothetical protein